MMEDNGRRKMIEYKSGKEHLDWTQLCELYYEVGLIGGHGHKKNTDKILLAFKNSNKVISAWSNNKIIGAGRMITDGVYGCIFDVGVLPEFQRQGIGKGIMRHLLQDTEFLSVQLWPTKGNIAFYEKLGFFALGSDHPVMLKKRVQ